MLGWNNKSVNIVIRRILTKSPITCEDCGQGFDTIDSLKEHQEKVASAKGAFEALGSIFW